MGGCLGAALPSCLSSGCAVQCSLVRSHCRVLLYTDISHPFPPPLSLITHTPPPPRFIDQGFPTIKLIHADASGQLKAIDYSGGRTAKDLVQWAMNVSAGA